MRRRNFYLVLGIPPDASSDMIRWAYRRLAKAYHPDRAGPGGAPHFHEVAEAYHVLSDPERRSAHNATLGQPRLETLERVEPGGRWGAGEVEPLVAEPIGIRSNFRTSHSSIEEEFVDWTKGYSTERRVPKSGHHREVDLDVILTPEEASVGGILPIDLPVFGVCATCGGRGRDVFSFCYVCSGLGVREGCQSARLRIPEMVPDGTTWEIRIPEGGLRLRVRIRVDPFSR